jgi:hypothetical protein
VSGRYHGGMRIPHRCPLAVLAVLAVLATCAYAAAPDPAHEHHHGDPDLPQLAWVSGDWSLHLHGFANAIHDEQTGPRGDVRNVVTSMFMATAQTRCWELKAMLSLDPLMGPGGYPLLFQTGETANGRTHLLDRQHPHDFFMELSAAYRVPLGEDDFAFAYVGLPGEPALGPPTFMHRASGMRIPEAPLTHHFLDSTHITMGVATAGVVRGPWKAELSRFNGREPDQHRWDIETRSLDSTSARLTYAPSGTWSFQASYGDLRSPEQVEPLVRIRRSTASAIYQGDLAGMPLAATFAWGRNDKTGHGPRHSMDGWLLEGTLDVATAHALLARIERVRHDELGGPFGFAKASLGYIHDFAATGPVRWGAGALASALKPPRDLEFFYGHRPRGALLFLQARFG